MCAAPTLSASLFWPRMKEARFCLLVALFALAALGGCGSDDEGGKTVVQTVTETQPASTTSSTTVSTATSETATASRARRLTQFQTPSHNIGCYMSKQEGGSVRCDIREHSWTAPPKPAFCDVDWGGGVQVGPKRRASIVCAGDTVLDLKSPVLDYGQGSRAGKILCASGQAGMRCTNRSTGHGFFLARERYVLF